MTKQCKACGHYMAREDDGDRYYYICYNDECDGE
jgi:hypothetical protein